MSNFLAEKLERKSEIRSIRPLKIAIFQKASVENQKMDSSFKISLVLKQ